jgi:RNA recognition motif-containing protein
MVVFWIGWTPMLANRPPDTFLKGCTMNIYVGNLSYDTQDQDLLNAFSAHGEVASARVISDRETGRSRGFGFVEMPDRNQAQAAMSALNGADLQGRTISANEAREREERSPRSGGGGGGRSRY